MPAMTVKLERALNLTFDGAQGLQHVEYLAFLFRAAVDEFFRIDRPIRREYNRYERELA